MSKKIVQLNEEVIKSELKELESKNAEMKRFHGLARARGYGLLSVTQQAKLTAIAVNLKRIAALVKKKGPGTGLKKAARSVLSGLSAAVRQVWAFQRLRRVVAC